MYLFAYITQAGTNLLQLTLSLVPLRQVLILEPGCDFLDLNFKADLAYTLNLPASCWAACLMGGGLGRIIL